MRTAMIMAGGLGTRLWPLSRAGQPKQLIRMIQGKSLLQLAFNRLGDVVLPQNRYICAGKTHQNAIFEMLDELAPDHYLAEPLGRDTLNAVGFAAAVVRKKHPQAIMAVLTADHIIEPAQRFCQVLEAGFELVRKHPNTLVTFGITPTHAATGYGYLQLSDALPSGARQVSQYKEKPEAKLAEQYLQAGPDRYLWNSGMFIWHVETLLDCIKRHAPENHAGLMRIAEAWDTPRQQDVLEEVYPTLPKVSVDYAIMEPAATDSQVQVAALPMNVRWLDVGSWTALAQTLDADDHDNTPDAARHLLLDTHKTLVVSEDPQHLIATIGCEDLVIVHTRQSTLICHKDHVQKIKDLQAKVAKQFPEHA